jgi:hypothetical protein
MNFTDHKNYNFTNLQHSRYGCPDYPQSNLRKFNPHPKSGVAGPCCQQTQHQYSDCGPDFPRGGFYDTQVDTIYLPLSEPI